LKTALAINVFPIPSAPISATCLPSCTWLSTSTNWSLSKNLCGGGRSPESLES
jgi:hypothetical protein